VLSKKNVSRSSMGAKKTKQDGPSFLNGREAVVGRTGECTLLADRRVHQHIRLDPSGLRDLAGAGLGVSLFSRRVLHLLDGHNRILPVLLLRGEISC